MREVLDVEALRGRDGGDVLGERRATSLESDLRMVVLPELSSPSTRMRSYSFLFLRRLRRMPISPPACVDIRLLTRITINKSGLRPRHPQVVAALQVEQPRLHLPPLPRLLLMLATSYSLLASQCGLQRKSR